MNSLTQSQTLDMTRPHYAMRYRHGTPGWSQLSVQLQGADHSPHMRVHEDDEYCYVWLPKSDHIIDSMWDGADLITDSETGQQWGRSLGMFKINPKDRNEIGRVNEMFGTDYTTEMVL